MNSIKEKNFLGLPASLAVLCLGLFLVFFCFYFSVFKTAPILTPDSHEYMQVAQDLSDFHLDNLHHRTFGYPLLLLLTGSSVAPTKALFVVSLLLHFSSIWIGAILLTSLGMTKKIIAFFVFLLLLPLYAQSAAFALTENLTEFFLTAAVASFVLGSHQSRNGLIFLGAVLFSLSAFVRPVYQLLPFVLSLTLAGLSYLTKRKQLLKTAGILFFPSFFILGSLIMFNIIKFNYAGFSPGIGHHLSTRTVNYIEKLPSEYDGVRKILIEARDASLIEPNSGHKGLMYIWNASPKLQEATGYDFVELDKYLHKMNKELIVRKPLNYLLAVLDAGIIYWFPYITKSIIFENRLIMEIWSLVHFVIVTVFFVQGILVGAFFLSNIIYKLINTKSLRLFTIENGLLRSAYFLLGGTVFYTMIFSCCFEMGDPRFRVPTDIFIILMIFLGFKLWMKIINNIPQRFSEQ